MTEEHAERSGRGRDLGMCVALALIHGVMTFLHSRGLDPRLYGFDAMNVWFEGDPPRIFANMTDRWSSHGRQFVHPLFSLIGCAPPYLLVKAGGLDPLLAVRLVGAGVAAIWAAVVYGACRCFGARWLDAALFTALGMVSASAMFWFVLPESYPFGAVSIVLALAFVAAGERRRFPLWADLLVNAMTFWFTVTNWMVGMLASLVRRGWKQAAGLSLAALLLTAGLWLVQRQVFPDSYFFGRAVMEVQYALPEGTGGPGRISESFFLHSMVMPEITVFQKFEGAPYPVMTSQQTGAGSAGPVGLVAVGLWAAMLLAGLVCLLRDLARPVHRVLGLSLLGQWVLHLLYGDETFLYSLHFSPLLLLLAALPLRTRARPWVLGLAGALLVCAALNNLPLLREASEFFEHHPSAAVAVQPGPAD